MSSRRMNAHYMEFECCSMDFASGFQINTIRQFSLFFPHEKYETERNRKSENMESN